MARILRKRIRLQRSIDLETSVPSFFCQVSLSLTADRLVLTRRGGLFHRNGAGQEQFCWDIRSEPEVIKTFAKIWGTEELLVSVGTSIDL
jgi:hypothetical protein